MYGCTCSGSVDFPELDDEEATSLCRHERYRAWRFEQLAHEYRGAQWDRPYGRLEGRDL